MCLHLVHSWDCDVARTRAAERQRQAVHCRQYCVPCSLPNQIGIGVQRGTCRPRWWLARVPMPASWLRGPAVINDYWLMVTVLLRSKHVLAALDFSASLSKDKLWCLLFGGGGFWIVNRLRETKQIERNIFYFYCILTVFLENHFVLTFFASHHILGIDVE